MLKQLVPALLLVVSATAALSASSRPFQAAEECKARPGATAPPGTGWYYRVNRTDRRRCWFLGTKSGGAHFARRRQFADDSSRGVRQEQQAGAQPQVTSSQLEVTDDALSAARTTGPQVAAPDDRTKYLVPRSIRTLTFRQLSPDGQTPSETVVKPVRTVEQTPAGVHNFTTTLDLLIRTAATGLLFVGGGLFLAHLLRRRSEQQTVVRGGDPEMAAPFEVPVVRAPPMTSNLPNAPPVAADDLTQSLRELRRNLRKAEASIQSGFSEHASSCRARELAF